LNYDTDAIQTPTTVSGGYHIPTAIHTVSIPPYYDTFHYHSVVPLRYHLPFCLLGPDIRCCTTVTIATCYSDILPTVPIDRFWWSPFPTHLHHAAPPPAYLPRFLPCSVVAVLRSYDHCRLPTPPGLIHYLFDSLPGANIHVTGLPATHSIRHSTFTVDTGVTVHLLPVHCSILRSAPSVPRFYLRTPWCSTCYCCVPTTTPLSICSSTVTVFR